MNSHQTSIRPSQATLAHLQTLLGWNIDSRDGLSYAAKLLAAKDSNAAAAFLESSHTRDEFAAELSGIIAANDEDSPQEGSTNAIVHRAWLGLRSTLSGVSDIQSIIDESERGEDYLKEAYEFAINAIPELDVRDILTRQYASVKLSLDGMRVLHASLA